MLTCPVKCVNLLITIGELSMKQGLTNIIFIVDRSGSMQNIANDMIGGFNSYIENQKKVPGECFVSFYQFDDIYETVFERTKLADVPELTRKTYSPRGSTALYDAIGRTIDEYGAYLSSLKEEDRPERVLVITLTDGYNNASTKYSLAQVRDRIKTQTETYKWDFVFLGSNIDAWEAGEGLGVARSATMQFASVGSSVKMAFASLADSSTGYRSAASKTAYSFKKEDQDAQNQFVVKVTTTNK